MDYKVEVLKVASAKDLVMNYLETPANTFMVGFAEDIQKFVLSVRFLEGMYGFAGTSLVEKGQLSKEVYENNDNEFIDAFDLYSLYILDGDETEFLVVSSILNYEGDDEFGTRYKIDFKEQEVEQETLPVAEVKEYIEKIEYPRKDKAIIKLN